MKILFSLLIFTFSIFSFARQDQRIQGKWAYYGEDFYQILQSRQFMSRALLFKIFNGYHQSRSGKYDEISDSCGYSGNCYRHHSVGYDQARKIMFGELDGKRDSRGTYVVDVYCGKKFYYRSLEDVSRMHTVVNIEHTWPQSKFNRSYPKDIQKSDMHHLFLTDSRANSTRGNSPFGVVSTYDDRMGGEGCAESKFGFVGYGAVYTPPASHRGNIARALFYFSMHYNLPISQSEERLLRVWHRNDPVDQDEVIRHEKIAYYQMVRNPFIDHPELVDQIQDF